MRPIVDRALADRVLDEMSSLHVEMTNNWNRRYRENMERLKSGDLFQVAQVVKGSCSGTWTGDCPPESEDAPLRQADLDFRNCHVPEQQL